MRFCIDCAHCNSGGLGDKWKCEAPQAEDERNPLWGTFPECKDMRRYATACGHSALWFKPQEKK